MIPGMLFFMIGLVLLFFGQGAIRSFYRMMRDSDVEAAIVWIGVGIIIGAIARLAGIIWG